ncbi:SdpI family protein [Halotia wernerae UHCC 0503]|nr:SdpI family protein [Halotia wernerae UHCC 0503]
MSLPLILGKVPPNAWYGFRVAKTFASERIWYMANRAGGYNLLYAGITIAVTAVVTKLLVSKYGLSNNIFNSVNLAIFIFALVVTTLRSFLALNRL